MQPVPLEQEAQTRLASSDTLTPEETAYYGALVDYAMECRPLLNTESLCRKCRN